LWTVPPRGTRGMRRDGQTEGLRSAPRPVPQRRKTGDFAVNFGGTSNAQSMHNLCISHLQKVNGRFSCTAAGEGVATFN
jgi:hypothetical protein